MTIWRLNVTPTAFLSDKNTNRKTPQNKTDTKNLFSPATHCHWWKIMCPLLRPAVKVNIAANTPTLVPFQRLWPVEWLLFVSKVPPHKHMAQINSGVHSPVGCQDLYLAPLGKIYWSYRRLASMAGLARFSCYVDLDSFELKAWQDEMETFPL